MEDIGQVLGSLTAKEEEVSALQQALKDNKRLIKERNELLKKVSHLEDMLKNVPVAPIGDQNLVPIGTLEHVKELHICQSQIEILHGKAKNQQLEFEDVKALQILIDSKLKVLNNTLDLKKASKKQLESQITDIEILRELKEQNK